MYRQTLFTKLDILKALLVLESHGAPISRLEMAEQLQLGEGSTRSILDVLKESKISESTRAGHFLSDKGRSSVKRLRKLLEGPKEVTLSIEKSSKKIALVVRGAAQNVSGMKDRDIAVKNGADGALVLCQNKCLHFPGQEKVPFSYTKAESFFELKDTDVLTIAFAEKEEDAERGALAIALHVSPKLNRFIESLI